MINSYWSTRNFKRKGKICDFSIIKKLLKEKKINNDFLIFLNNLTLEEIIAIKLESASRIINGKLFALPLWHSLVDITRDAIMKYALSAAKGRKETIKFLGLNWRAFYKFAKRYAIQEYMGHEKI